ncbi:hypothetical protein [Bradyrhizobium sp. WSM1743]|uniref:hypothetical protein n=1 Tax=Bradyrhizobium sp. WSM1743 TaxID=318996 RepID=UPI0012EC0237|nr:hypothetical protein [Bradyrhizobium sp. WSM1743]
MNVLSSAENAEGMFAKGDWAESALPESRMLEDFAKSRAPDAAQRFPGDAKHRPVAVRC